ncbi:hypothetical protein ARMGADRAFT_927444, partial [Armillaria gallica]
WQVIQREEVSGEAEKIVFVMNGIICRMDLPLVFRVPKTTNNKLTILSQKVTIIGLNTSFFTEVMDTIKEINLMAQHKFKEETLKPWTMSNFQGMDALECMNRYFRRIANMEGDTSIPFSRDIVPKGILTEMVRPDLTHTEENSVQYFRSSVLGDGKRRYHWAKPQMFRNGDIAEISFTVVIIRGKKGTF